MAKEKADNTLSKKERDSLEEIKEIIEYLREKIQKHAVNLTDVSMGIVEILLPAHRKFAALHRDVVHYLENA